MPATEQTWRDSKLLHLVFGISGAGDAGDDGLDAGGRPPPRVEGLRQRKFRDIETWYRRARLSQQGPMPYYHDVKQAREQLEATRGQVPDGNAGRRVHRARGRSRADRTATTSTQARERRQGRSQARQAKVDLKPSTTTTGRQPTKISRPDSRRSFASACKKLIGKAQFREDNLASAQEIPQRRSRRARAASTSWASATNCPKSELETQARASQTRSSSDVDAADVAVQERQDASAGAGSDRRPDGRRRDRRHEETRRSERQTDAARKSPLRPGQQRHGKRRCSSLPILDAFGGPLRSTRSGCRS